ncbi:hypothetical protein OPKNFCMD_5766 [Methylobacterium crusticola]|uniref:Uncharacterized protein n=1 Tax=Methylobacterium crusticola TaxID=1697972 RepID=A0ABQ4R5N0_9HYPH|nr:hypothetical protein OPKNFCMD_5766 [Methylobacterium crusticola]
MRFCEKLTIPGSEAVSEASSTLSPVAPPAGRPGGRAKAGSVTDLRSPGGAAAAVATWLKSRGPLLP